MDVMIDKELLKKARLEKNWSQEDLASESGLSHRTIQRIEATGTCSISSKKALTQALELDDDALDFALETRGAQLNRVFAYYRTTAALLFIPLLTLAILLVARNYHGSSEFTVVISNPGDITTDTLKVNLAKESQKIFELRDGYSLEVNYLYGLTPTLKAKLYRAGESGKVLLHSSTRKGTDFKPVEYVICPEERVRYVSPRQNVAMNCSNPESTKTKMIVLAKT